MDRSSLKRRFQRLKKAWRGSPDRFFSRVSGVIHVGANVGQERRVYALYGLKALWIEPIPEVFETLCENLRGFPGQRAVRALVTDCDGREYPFNVANHHGSSSLFDLGRHGEIWPEIAYERMLTLRGATLPSVLRAEGIDPAGYNALVLDTQGSELLVLRGAEPMLANFSLIKTEAADFEMYAGGCQREEIDAYLSRHGFRECWRESCPQPSGGGNCFNVIYERNA